MIKVKIHGFKESINYEVKVAYLKTNTYDKKLLKNEIHTPNAAKLILVNKKEEMKAIYLLSPIINISSNGDIIIWTDLGMKKILNNEWIKKINLKKLKNKLNALNKKNKIGITIKEILQISNLETQLELCQLKLQKEYWEKD